EESLTTAKFPTLFGGGELVVAGRLEPGTRELWCAIRSSDGNATAAAPQPAVANVTSAERLWAYLTVRQLLDSDAATPNETVRTKAKDLALRYSFVTSVTSLVVVKPNETSAVNLDEPDESGGPTLLRSASMPLSFHQFGHAVHFGSPGYTAFRASSQFLPRPPSYPLHQLPSLDFSFDAVRTI
ncbi:hypothetical protein, partial [Escherichia coli]|uniref:hypothetical protein n=1 Tax=Escherichia coli TaxID=562 RepID=UPI00225AAC1F